MNNKKKGSSIPVAGIFTSIFPLILPLISISFYTILTILKNKYMIEPATNEVFFLWLWIIGIVILFCTAVIPTIVICRRELTEEIADNIYRLHLKTMRAITISSMLIGYQARAFAHISIISKTFEELHNDDSDFAKGLHAALMDKKKVKLYIPRGGEDFDICMKRIYTFIEKHKKYSKAVGNIEVYKLTKYFRFLLNDECFILFSSSVDYKDLESSSEELFMGIRVWVEEERDTSYVVRCAGAIEDRTYVDGFIGQLNKCVNITTDFLRESIYGSHNTRGRTQRS